MSELEIALQPKQKELWRLVDESPHTRIGYGGARGGGKSDGARKVLMLRRLKYPKTNGVLIRRTYGELYKNHIEPMFRTWPFMRSWYNDKNKELTFPNGSKLYFGYAEHKGDLYALAQGPEYADVLVEEATHFHAEELQYLYTVNRWTGSDIVPKTIWTCNPGNVGHAEVKRVMIDRQFRENEDPDAFAFIQAYGWDNIEWVRKYLREQEITDRQYYGWTDEERFECFVTHSDYGRALNSLGDKERKAHLFGDWDTFAGQYFTNWDRKERELAPATVMALVRPWWRKWISQDWGFAHSSSVHWHAVGDISPDDAERYLGRKWDKARQIVLTFQEYVDSRINEDELAKQIVTLTSEPKEIKRFFLSPDAFAKKQSANTIAQTIGDIVGSAGIPRPEHADNDRIGGWRFMHGLIERDEWFISANCPEALKAIPELMHDEDKKEDVLKTDLVSDDVADDLRYGLKTMLDSAEKPKDIQLAERLEQFEGNNTGKHLAHLKFEEAWKKKRNQFVRPAKWTR